MILLWYKITNFLCLNYDEKQFLHDLGYPKEINTQVIVNQLRYFQIEGITLSDDYFVSRNLYPNIDFYTGIILTALKIPKSMFSPIFVIGRTVRWITQWIEFKKDKTSKIARPRQLYRGD